MLTLRFFPRAHKASFFVQKKLYPLESLRAAAFALAGRAEVSLEEDGPRYRVALKAAARLDKAGLRSLAGEFLNELLSCAVRARLLEAHRTASEYVVTRAVISSLRDKADPWAPPPAREGDLPLEDRRAARELLEDSRRMVEAERA